MLYLEEIIIEISILSSSFKHLNNIIIDVSIIYIYIESIYCKSSY